MRTSQRSVDLEGGRGSSFRLIETPRTSEDPPNAGHSNSPPIDDNLLEPESSRKGCPNPCQRRYMLPCASGSLFALSVACLLFGLLMPHVLNKELVDRAQVCSSDSSGFDHWLTNDPANKLGISGPFVPRYRKFYAWNLTNPSEFEQGGKPVVRELGPYTFHSYSTKFNVSFGPSTQTYRTWYNLEYSPENSCVGCSENDTVTMLNPVYLELLTKSGGERNFVLAAGIPTVLDAIASNATFLGYASQHCALPSSVTADTKLALSTQLLGCVFNSRPKASALLKHQANHTMEPYLDELLAGCGFSTASMSSSEKSAVLACGLSYWGAPEYNPADNNLVDQSLSLIRLFLIDKDGLIVSKTVQGWYKGGPSVLASLLEPGSDWPGFGVKHADSLRDANLDPAIEYDTVVSGCDGSIDRIGDFVMAQNQSWIDFSFWGKNVLMPVSGSNNVQTTPRGVDALSSSDNGPYSETLFEWSDQLKRAAALTFTGGVDYKGVHVNRFELPQSELVGTNKALQPGVDALGSELGVGVLPGVTRDVPGIVDMSPFEGFPVFVSMPHYFNGDPLLQQFAELQVGNHSGDYISFMEVEPATGTTFGGALRLQAATMLNRTAQGGSMTSLFYPNVTPQVLVPLYWIDETAFISDHDLAIFKEAVELNEAAKWILYIGPALFCVLAVLCTVWTAKDRGLICQRSHQPLEEREDRRSSLLSSQHSKATEYPEQGTWSERCSLAQEYAKSCTERLGGCTRASGASVDSAPSSLA